VTTKVVTTTGFAEDPFNEGLVAINFEAKEPKESCNTMCYTLVTYDVISEDSPKPLELFRL
jgi:hypothetical protein